MSFAQDRSGPEGNESEVSPRPKADSMHSGDDEPIPTAGCRLQNVSKTGEHSRAQQSAPEHNELTTRQRISRQLRRKSRAINQLAFWGGAGSTPAASTTYPPLLQ